MNKILDYLYKIFFTFVNIFNIIKQTPMFVKDTNLKKRSVNKICIGTITNHQLYFQQSCF